MKNCFYRLSCIFEMRSTVKLQKKDSNLQDKLVKYVKYHGLFLSPQLLKSFIFVLDFFTVWGFILTFGKCNGLLEVWPLDNMSCKDVA